MTYYGKSVYHTQNGKMTAKEIFVDMLQYINTTNGLNKLRANVCGKWCTFGNHCNEDVCPFAKAFYKREPEVVLIEEQREIIEKRARGNMKDRIIHVKHRGTTKNYFAALKRSCSCAIKRAQTEEQKYVLNKIMDFVKRSNKPMIKYWAAKAEDIKILEVIKKYEK